MKAGARCDDEAQECWGAQRRGKGATRVGRWSGYPTTVTMLAFGGVLALTGGLRPNLGNLVLAVLFAFGLDLVARMDTERAGRQPRP